MFRRLRAVRWQVFAAVGALALVCTGCGSTSPPRPLGEPARGPILSVVTAQVLQDGRPHGLTQYFAIKTRTVYGAVFLGDLHGATQLVMTWSKLTAHGLQVLFSKEVPVTSNGIAYTSAVTPGTLPTGTYNVSASVAGVTRSVYWSVFTPRGLTAAAFAKTAVPLRPGSSGSLPQLVPKIACDQVQSSVSMPSTTDVRLVVSAYCPQDSSTGPTRGVLLATMDRGAGDWLVGRLGLQHTGMLTGTFNLDVCDLPGGSNQPGTALRYSSVIYYRGSAREFSGIYHLPPAHLPPVVFIGSSVPAGAQVYPGQKIVLHVSAAEPVSFGSELPVKSIIVTDSSGHIVKKQGFLRAKAERCGTQQFRREIRLTYTVPAGVHGPLTLTATANGVPDQVGQATITFNPAR